MLRYELLNINKNFMFITSNINYYLLNYNESY